MNNALVRGFATFCCTIMLAGTLVGCAPDRPAEPAPAPAPTQPAPPPPPQPQPMPMDTPGMTPGAPGTGTAPGTAPQM
jgi:hypothetical protein